jgi:hypothetical protein
MCSASSIRSARSMRQRDATGDGFRPVYSKCSTSRRIGQTRRSGSGASRSADREFRPSFATSLSPCAWLPILKNVSFRVAPGEQWWSARPGQARPRPWRCCTAFTTCGGGVLTRHGRVVTGLTAAVLRWVFGNRFCSPEACREYSLLHQGAGRTQVSAPHAVGAHDHRAAAGLRCTMLGQRGVNL